MTQDIERVLFSPQQLHDTVHRLGAKISADYAGKNLLLVSVLKGAVVFMTDLMREITIPCSIDFMAVHSYSGTQSTGEVQILKDLGMPIEGYDVLIVEDILDSGRTLHYIMDLLQNRHPSSIRICTLFDKPSGRKADVTADYVGMLVPDAFIVGYGLDYNEKYRNLPYIGVLKSEIYGG